MVIVGVGVGCRDQAVSEREVRPSPTVSLAIDHGRVDFGVVELGKAAPPQVVVVTNTGTASGTLNASLVSEHGMGFRIERTTCDQATIAPDGTCEVAIQFAPTQLGPCDAIVIASAPGISVVTALAGTGVTRAPAEAAHRSTTTFARPLAR